MTEIMDDSLSLDIGEDDLGEDAAVQDDTVTWSTDWTVSTIIDQLQRGRFDLEPAFQRRDVWTESRQSRFIESLLLGIPVPQLILAERPEARGRFIVLDGKQRLRTLQRFAGIDGQPLKLRGLEVLRHLNGYTYDDFRNQSALDRHASALENQIIRGVVLRGWRNESLLYLTFLRLNSNVVGLAPQELRRALHHGPFMDFVMTHSGQSKPIRSFLNIKAPDFRMRDAEILIRHIGISSRLADYRGNLRLFLDETCELGNRNWENLSGETYYYADSLDSAIVVTESIFGKRAFRRHTGRGWETRKNRAVLDVMAFYFQHGEVAREALDAPNDVVARFERECELDPNFAGFLAATTKTVAALHGRLAIWGAALADIAPSAARYIPVR